MAETSFGGVTLHVADVERAKAFYLSIPGATLAHERPGQFAIIRLGAGRIGRLKTGRRDFHLEIGTDHLDELIAHLQAAGIDREGPQPERWGERGMLTRDPDGNFVEFDDHLDR